MELLSALNRRLKELQEWRLEVVLAIRKAFTFEDVMPQDDLSGIPPSISFEQGLVFVKTKEGYGLRDSSYRYQITMRPDVVARGVVITKTIAQISSGEGSVPCVTGEEILKTYVDAPVTSQGDISVDLVDTLREEIVYFLAAAELDFVPIDW